MWYSDFDIFVFDNGDWLYEYEMELEDFDFAVRIILDGTNEWHDFLDCEGL